MNASSTTFSLAAITVCALIQVLAQVIFQVVIAKEFGATAEVDTFSAALAIPTVLMTILTNSISYLMVPLLVPLAQQSQPASSPPEAQNATQQEFKQVAFAIGLCAIGSCLIASLLIGIFASPITALLYHKFSPAHQELTSTMLRMLSPLIILSSFQGWLQGIYHSRQNFLMPALASAFGPSFITGMLFIPVRLEQPIHWLAWCLLLGSVVSVSCVLPAIRFGIPQKWTVHPTALLAVRRSIPLIAFNSYTKLDPILDRVLLAGLTVGAISHLNYAQRFITALILIATSGVSTLAFSDLSGAYSNDNSLFRARFFENLRRMILVVVPIVIGLSLFAQPSIKTLLERGQFRPEDTIQVSTLLVALIGFFVASAVGDLIAKCFYALGDTRTPSAIGAIAFTLGIVMKLIGVNYSGVLGLAIATSAYTFLSVLIMMLFLFWRLKLRDVHKELGFTVLRSSVAAILASLVALIGLWIPIPGAWWFAVLLGAISYTILLLIMRDPTWRNMVLRQQ